MERCGHGGVSPARSPLYWWFSGAFGWGCSLEEDQEEGRLRMCTLTHRPGRLRSPLKSLIPHRYAELMQDLLRQRGNTAELCSLCCQQTCKEKEGEQACTGRGGEREGEYKQCHSVQKAMLQSTLPCREGTSPASMRHQWVSTEKFFFFPPWQWAFHTGSGGIQLFPWQSSLACASSPYVCLLYFLKLL